MELENLPKTTNTKHIREVLEFNKKLLLVFKALNTMKKINTAVGHVNWIMNKLQQNREVLAKKDNNEKNWCLNEISENLEKFVSWKNPFTKKRDEISSYDKEIKRNVLTIINRDNRLLVTRNNYY